MEGKALLKRAMAERKLELVDAATASFGRARQHFRSAEDYVRGSTLLTVAGRIPLAGDIVGVRVRAVTGVAEMGVALADAGDQASAIDRVFIKPSGHNPGAGVLLGLLQDIQPRVQPLRDDFVRAVSAASTVDETVLPGAQRQGFIDARATVAKAATAANQFEQLSPFLMDIVGGKGRRTYLVEQVNPAELRAGGGFIGTVSLVQLEAGNFKLLFSGDVSEFDHYSGRIDTPGHVAPPAGPDYVAPPNAFTDWYKGQSWYFADSNLFPDFATNAKWGAFFAKRLQGVQIDGVISLDYYAVAAMLDTTGPIALPKFGVTLDSKNFVSQVLSLDISNDPIHKPIIAEAAKDLMGKVSSLPADRWPSLIQVIGESARARHFQLAFEDPVIQTQISRLGWTSTLNPEKTADFLYETEDNLGGTKGNPFLTRRYALNLTRVAGSLHHKLTVDFDYRPPAGVHLLDHYYAYVRFYAKEPMTNVTLRKTSSEYTALIPPPYPDTGAPSGYKVSDGWIFIDAGPGHSGHMQLTLEYDTPWTADASGKHALMWEKQPGTEQDKVAVSWTAGQKTFSATTTLDQDRLISIGPRGIAVAPAGSSVAVPSLGF